MAAMLWHSRVRTTHAALHAVVLWEDGTAPARAIILRVTLHILTVKPQPEPPPCTGRGKVVLFFDGGSRGNPGLGGSGAVLVCVGADGIGASLTWAGSASFAHASAASNYAEYQGLTAAAHHHFGLIHVVGDSAMILRQLRTTTPPRSEKLRPLYARARLLADKTGVNSWQRHYRAHNKLADQLANAAMDSCCSAQDMLPTSHKQLGGAQQFLANDVGHWTASPDNTQMQ